VILSLLCSGGVGVFYCCVSCWMSVFQCGSVLVMGSGIRVYGVLEPRVW